MGQRNWLWSGAVFAIVESDCLSNEAKDGSTSEIGACSEESPDF
jgi:hypothetical protein